ncbi:hypothetical protein JNO63_05865 [Anaerococcus sp. mt242]|uniref:hypothetical protein n=1 Tax=Anaerococcus sp. mt242 TaxID=2661917 RepID=UPI001931C277|nr:hypothetical protein [Anaerococcus sp. mt242]MBM0046616.1 hypothetical protein [Anaerococcus sp. mt242]
MRRVYKFLASIVLISAIFTGCEKKVEEVKPTETTTTIIEVDKDKNENQDDEESDEDTSEKTEENN